MNNDELIAAVSELEQGIGLQNGFFGRLVSEDDWSFIIKIHALYEAAVTKLITEKVGKDSLESFFSRLELGDRSRGKLRLLKDLRLLDDEERKFIYALSEIRNDFVHDVRNTNANLITYLEALSSEKRKHYVDTFGYTYTPTLEISGKKVDSKVFTRENPRIAIWHNSMHVLAIVSSLTATEKAKKRINEAITKIHELQNG